MGLESGTFVNDLDATNPPSGDQVSQGDDHLRLLKTVLKNTFPSATKAFYFPTTLAKSADFNVLAAQMNTTFLVDTSGGNVAANMPSLAAGDAGWQCFVMKTTTDTNAIFVTPPSGTIQSGDLAGLAKTRRAIPGVPSRVLWTGSAWIAERAERAPVGSIIDFNGASPPVGYELPNGQTLSGTAGSVYPDYYARTSSLVTSDITGRVVAMKEASATRLTSAVSGVDGATLGAAGGAQSVVLVQANLPNVTLNTAIGSGQGSHTHTSNAATSGGNSFDAGGFGGPQNAIATINAATLPAMTGTTPTGGTDTAHANVQPVIVLNKLLVVE